MLRDELRIEVVLQSDEREIMATVLGECKRLRSSPGTALVVCPDLAPTNFLKFLETYTILVEGLLPDHDLQDDVQIAPFHPLFVFGNDNDDYDNNNNNNDNNNNNNDVVVVVVDSINSNSINNNDDSIDNYTNRSPYPTFHVLREAEVEKAVDVLEGNAETVWKRNVDLLEAMEDLFNKKTNGNDENDNDSKQQQQQASMTLLRSVFLKGKANRRLEQQDEQNSTDSSKTSSSSSSSSSCPVPTMETIQAFQKRIKGLLKEFRKKDYWIQWNGIQWNSMEWNSME